MRTLSLDRLVTFRERSASREYSEERLMLIPREIDPSEDTTGWSPVQHDSGETFLCPPEVAEWIAWIVRPRTAEDL